MRAASWAIWLVAALALAYQYGELILLLMPWPPMIARTLRRG